MEALTVTLPILCKGMSGIFLVIGIIALSTCLINRCSGPK